MTDDDCFTAAQMDALADRLDVVLEHGPGWGPLVSDLVDAMDAVTTEWRAVQVKEKFGRLRFYWDPAGDDWDTNPYRDGLQALVDDAEEVSVFICEECGAPGELRRRRGWYFTACDDCTRGHHK